MLFPLYTKEHGQTALGVRNSQCIISVSLKNKNVGNSLARIILQSEVPQGQWSMKSPLLMTVVFSTHSSSKPEPCVLPWAHGGTVMLSKGTAAGFTVTRREHELMLDHKRGLPEVALRLLLSGAI